MITLTKLNSNSEKIFMLRVKATLASATILGASFSLIGKESKAAL